MSAPDSPKSDWAHFVSSQPAQISSQLGQCAYQLSVVINTRIAYEQGYSSELIFENESQARLHDLSTQIEEIDCLTSQSFHIKDVYGLSYHLAISPLEEGFSLFVERVGVILRNGVIDEPGNMIFATHHTLEAVPGTFLSLKLEEDSLEHAFETGLKLLNQLINKSKNSGDKGLQYFRSGRHLAYVDAGTLSYTAGIVGAALFMATSVGPGWLGFLISYLPASVVTTLAAAVHE